jgi:hypothetical protein
MNTAELVEWQKIAPNGLIYPWWTHPLLEQLELSDFSEMIWCEFGAGRGTAYLRNKAKWVDSIETDPDWAAQAQLDCQHAGLLNGSIHGQHLRDGIPEDMPKYFAMIPDRRYDVISVDGIFRDQCLQWTIDHFKGRTGLLIIDNLGQDLVWDNQDSVKLIESYPCETFHQPDHTNHWGKPWNSRLVIIPA